MWTASSPAGRARRAHWAPGVGLGRSNPPVRWVRSPNAFCRRRIAAARTAEVRLAGSQDPRLGGGAGRGLEPGRLGRRDEAGHEARERERDRRPDRGMAADLAVATEQP